MKHILVTLLASVVIFGCSDDDLCLVGSGTTTRYDIAVGQFTGISLSGPINLRIEQGATQAVQIIAEPEIFNEMEYEVSNQILEVGFRKNIDCFETNFGVWVELVTPDIQEIRSSGVSEIISQGDLNLDELLVSVSGVADVVLSGEVIEQHIVASGVLNLKNFELVASITTVDIAGSAELELFCNDQLDIEVSGDATIRYKGNPNITQDISGTLDLIDAN